MSFDAMAWATKQELPTSQKMVLVMLADRTNKDTGRCDPSHKRLASDCGMSVATLKRCLRSLSDNGYISVINRTTDKGSTSNHYQLEMTYPLAQNEPPPSSNFTPRGDQNELQTRKTNQEENHNPFKSPKGEPHGFDEFWQVYPRKQGKGQARKAWRKIKPSQDLKERILWAVEQQKQSEQWQKEGGTYIPLPATWLNQERWDDEIQTGRQRPNGGLVV